MLQPRKCEPAAGEMRQSSATDTLTLKSWLPIKKQRILHLKPPKNCFSRRFLAPDVPKNGRTMVYSLKTVKHGIERDISFASSPEAMQLCSELKRNLKTNKLISPRLSGDSRKNPKSRISRRQNEAKLCSQWTATALSRKINSCLCSCQRWSFFVLVAPGQRYLLQKMFPKFDRKEIFFVGLQVHEVCVCHRDRQNISLLTA